MVISDIGSTDDTALLCHTNRPRPPGSHHSGGDWFASYGQRVGSIGTTNVGFLRNRGSMVVRLLRDTNTGTPLDGIYRCSITDADRNHHNVYIGLYYNDGQGKYLALSELL